MQFTFGDKGEVYLLNESVLPVTGKERRGEVKSSIGPKMKYGHANHLYMGKLNYDLGGWVGIFQYDILLIYSLE